MDDPQDNSQPLTHPAPMFTRQLTPEEIDRASQMAEMLAGQDDRARQEMEHSQNVQHLRQAVLQPMGRPSRK